MAARADFINPNTPGDNKWHFGGPGLEHALQQRFGIRSYKQTAWNAFRFDAIRGRQDALARQVHEWFRVFWAVLLQSFRDVRAGTGFRSSRGWPTGRWATPGRRSRRTS